MTRITSIEWRLRRSAGELCPAKSATSGLRFDHIGAYRKRDRAMVMRVLGLSQAPQVAAVAPGSPGDLAGIRPGDELLAIDGKDVARIAATVRDPALLADEIEDVLSRGQAGATLDLLVRREGRQHTFALRPEMLCAVRYVLKTEPGTIAYTNGSEVAIPVGLIRFAANDDELALIAGHELAHIVDMDGKPANLEERRRMEDRADDVGAALAHCAGYDIGLALHFWERYERQERPRWLRKSGHRPAGERAARLAQLRARLACPVTLAD